MDDLEIRCTCASRALLARCGYDQKIGHFVHVKVYKQGRIFGEMIATGGVTHLRCRECKRWHLVRITTGGVNSRQQRLPTSLRL